MVGENGVPATPDWQLPPRSELLERLYALTDEATANGINVQETASPKGISITWTI